MSFVSQLLIQRQCLLHALFIVCLDGLGSPRLSGGTTVDRLELQAQAIGSAQQYQDNVVRKRVVDHAPDQV